MTECERLIANGTFSPDFFKPEVRCDFLVDENRKKLWAIMLDLLIQFDRVCRENGLRYFLNGGSLLGAIRHDGIIPWDDDIDVEMPREDYDKFATLQGQFAHPYLMQIPGEKGYGYSYIKLRNVMTTGASDVFVYEPYNQGIFLDVFPFDNIRKEESRFSYDTAKEYATDNSTCMRRSNPHLDAANRERVANCRHPNVDANLRVIDAVARYYNNVDCDYCGILACVITPYERHVMRKACYKESIPHEFEGFAFQIPSGYDEILRVAYGDYMKLPPANQRGCWHGGFTFLPDVPYDEYQNSVIGAAKYR